jgi:hypothetical protein
LSYTHHDKETAPLRGFFYRLNLIILHTKLPLCWGYGVHARG